MMKKYTGSLKLSRRSVLALSASVVLSPSLTFAQNYPNRPITLIVPWPAGGSADFASRLLAVELGKQLGQGVSIENIAGGSGIIGMNKAANAPADGHTIYWGGTEMYVPPMLNPKIRHDWKLLFKPIGRVLDNSLLFVTRSNAPFLSMDEMLAFARKNPGKLTYATPGIASGQHFLGEMLRDRAKIAIVHIPYRGGAQIVTDLLGGQIDTAILIGVTAIPHLKSGKIKALAIADSTRNPSFPSVPTFNEIKGLGGLVLNASAALYVPLKTPQAIAEKIEVALRASLLSSDIQKKIAEAAAVLRFTPASDMTKFVDDDTAKYKRIIEIAKIAVNE
jgi:tripartite-type tricarboxylate transporter receptor subunit TctC